jgi:hypothetical protein
VRCTETHLAEKHAEGASHVDLMPVAVITLLYSDNDALIDSLFQPLVSRVAELKARSFETGQSAW